ncbi:MAG: hypothetical protein JF586_11870 [Burkholderiales bacterium]|nr:hypothetical protein [Burkholderiales bacterium]
MYIAAGDTLRGTAPTGRQIARLGGERSGAAMTRRQTRIFRRWKDSRQFHPDYPVRGIAQDSLNARRGVPPSSTNICTGKRGHAPNERMARVRACRLRPRVTREAPLSTSRRRRLAPSTCEQEGDGRQIPGRLVFKQRQILAGKRDARFR